jgi:ABC-2 type transport system ATP-binding protein
MGAVITVDEVSKSFRLYKERNQSLKATIMRRGRTAFEEFRALDAVSTEIAAGETVGFIGENGSGKSTLLKCIARIITPDTGRISVEGKVSALLELGAGFHPELSGRENVYLNGSILGLSRRELDQRFDEIVDFAGLDRFIDAPVKNYSSGMYVRLGFSVAINVDPDVLLIDEVLAVGDEAFQRKCSAKFAELRESGKTIVVVSHSLAAIRSMCDRALWLDHGVAKAEGRAGDVIDAYLESMHPERAVEEGGGIRWGSGEAQIRDVGLLDASGRSTHHLRTGDAVTIRINWAAEQVIPRPVFNVVVYTAEGQVVSAPSTKDASVGPEELRGSGHVDLALDRMMLLPGTYDISVALTDHAGLQHISNRHRVLRFDVDPGTPHETFGGMVSLGGEWDFVTDAPGAPAV